MQAALTIVTAAATIVVAIATVVYARLVYRQVQLSEPMVLAYVGTRNGRPQVDVVNTGTTAAYQVTVAIDWSQPPDGLGDACHVESPEYGQLSPQQTLYFLSPHSLDLSRKGGANSGYTAIVSVSYSIAGGKTRSHEYLLNFGEHVARMREARQTR